MSKRLGRLHILTAPEPQLLFQDIKLLDVNLTILFTHREVNAEDLDVHWNCCKF